MAKVKKIFQKLDQVIPFEDQLSFDNAGFLVGDSEQEVTKILVALDITIPVIEEAIEMGAQMIVSHHPVIFHPARSVTNLDPVGKKIHMLASHNIAAICAHTNLDMAMNGVNDVLAERLKMKKRAIIQITGHKGPYEMKIGMGRHGFLWDPEEDVKEEPLSPEFKALLEAKGIKIEPKKKVDGPMDPMDFAQMVKERLNANAMRMVLGDRPISTFAVGGGACGDMLDDVIKLKCDAFVTADVKYDQFLRAKEWGITMIDAGHFATENPICESLKNWLEMDFPDVEVKVSEVHKDICMSL